MSQLHEWEYEMSRRRIDRNANPWLPLPTSLFFLFTTHKEWLQLFSRVIDDGWLEQWKLWNCTSFTPFHFIRSHYQKHYFSFIFCLSKTIFMSYFFGIHIKVVSVHFNSTKGLCHDDHKHVAVFKFDDEICVFTRCCVIKVFILRSWFSFVFFLALQYFNIF